MINLVDFIIVIPVCFIWKFWKYFILCDIAWCRFKDDQSIIRFSRCDAIAWKYVTYRHRQAKSMIIIADALTPNMGQAISSQYWVFCDITTQEELGQYGRLCPNYRSRFCPYQSVARQVTRCDFFREQAYIVVNTCHFVVKFAHAINPIS